MPVRYALNHDYFSSIGTEGKAYWLGFLAADGCVSGNNVSLTLAIIDADHVKAFRLAVGAQHQLTVRKQTCGYAKDTVSVGVRFHSLKMSADLARCGVVPRKSLTAIPWDGPPELMRHYWRGVVDGDGWISIGKTQFGIGLVGSDAMVSQFCTYAHIVTGARVTPVTRRHIKSAIISSSAAKSLIDHLWKDATIYLPRKKLKADEFLKLSFVSHKKWPDLTRDQMIDLHRKHKGWEAVAKELDVSYNTLQVYLRTKYRLTKPTILDD